jgi:hypothetical protein
MVQFKVIGGPTLLSFTFGGSCYENGGITAPYNKSSHSVPSMKILKRAISQWCTVERRM